MNTTKCLIWAKLTNLCQCEMDLDYSFIPRTSVPQGIALTYQEQYIKTPHIYIYIDAV